MNPTCPLLVILTVLVVSQRSQSSTEDPQYTYCMPLNCGGLNIRYPFYVQSRQPSYCGLQPFGVSCNSDNQTIIKLSIDDYIINNISYEDSLVSITNSAFSSRTSLCASSVHNLTLPGGFGFSVADSKLKHILVLQNCSAQAETTTAAQDTPQQQDLGGQVANSWKDFDQIKCSENELDVIVYEEDFNQAEFLDCGNPIVVPYEEEDYNGSYSNIEAILRKGIVVKYKANNCSQCLDSGGRCGVNNTTSELLCFCPDQPHRSSCPPSTQGKLGISIYILSDNSSVCHTNDFRICSLHFAGGRHYIIIYSQRGKIQASNFLSKDNLATENKNVENVLKSDASLMPKRCTYSDIKRMTNSFAEKLGEGGFGGVYKGKLLDGRLVAVKLLKVSKGNGEGFINKVASIGRTNHVNVVTLLGFCFEGNKRALVYEYISNGSLEKFIHGNSTLPLETLFQVVLGVARGLEYLHRGCQTRILHFDIKPHNILLDEEFCPKISDFGLAKLSPRNKQSKVSMSGARGTVGYIAPEVFCTSFGDVSHKSDVYSYGMMVLEVIGSRKRANANQIESSSEQYFPNWIYKQLEHEDEVEVDINLNDNDKELKRKMIVVSLWCIQPVPSSRPSMSRVVQMLEGSLESIDVPTMPSHSSPPRIQWDPSSSSTMSVSVAPES